MKLLTAFRAAALCLPLSLSAQSGFDIALIGDVPYGTAAEPRYERVIVDINKANVDFTFHIGDTKSGSTRCDNAHCGGLFLFMARCRLGTSGESDDAESGRIVAADGDPLSHS